MPSDNPIHTRVASKFDVAIAPWLVWALLSALIAALTAIFATIGVANINSDLATGGCSCITALTMR